MANRSSAVTNDRKAPRDGLEDFPTPPWAVRAGIEYAIKPAMRLSGFFDPAYALSKMEAWEPACGRGFMADALTEAFHRVRASDIADYGYRSGQWGQINDFTSDDDDGGNPRHYNWIITNPPFGSLPKEHVSRAEKFTLRALELASTGVAMLVRANFLEGTGRYERIFSKRPPSIIAYFTERVSIVPGKVDPKANQPTAYVWLVWTAAPPQPVVWIPPCRAALTRADDHIPPAERRR